MKPLLAAPPLLLLYCVAASSTLAFKTTGYHSYTHRRRCRLEARQPALKRDCHNAGISLSNSLEYHLSCRTGVETQPRRSRPRARRCCFSTTALLMSNSDNGVSAQLILKQLVDINKAIGKLEDMPKKIDDLDKKVVDMDKAIVALKVTAEMQVTQSKERGEGLARILEMQAAQSKERDEGLAKILELRAAQSKEHDDGLAKLLAMQAAQAKERDEGLAKILELHAAQSKERDEGLAKILELRSVQAKEHDERLAKDIKNIEKLITSQQYQRLESSAAQVSLKSLSTVEKALSEADTTQTSDCEDSDEKEADKFGWKTIFAPLAFLVSKLVTSLSNAVPWSRFGSGSSTGSTFQQNGVRGAVGEKKLV